MKKLFFTFVLIHCVRQGLLAQKPVQQKLLLHSINAVGLQNGSSGSSFSMQSILGVSVKHSFAGIGAGLDLYKFRSVPLFVDLRQELGGKKRNLFLYGDIGYNLPWLTDQQKELQRQQFNSDNFKASLYYDAGLGYQIRFHADALLLGAGYSYKELKSRVNEFTCTGMPCRMIEQTYRYRMPRVVIKAGWRF